MKSIKIDESFEISQVTAGCMRAADAKMEGDNFLRFVESCMDMGVTTFDHAPVYGGYTCEKLFGDAVLRKKPEIREKMQLITKTGIVLKERYGNKTIYYNSSKEEIIREMDESLQNFGTDHVDILLVHRPDPLGDPAETADALDTLVAEGKVRYVGVSNFMPYQIETLQSYMKNRIVINQVELSVKNTENYFNGVTDNAFYRRMPLMAWSPLGGGSVFGGQDEQSVRLRKVLGEIADAHGTSIDVIMYAWLFVHPVGIAAITGTMNAGRVKSAVDALEMKLSYDEWYQILEASRGYSVP
ncbi:MAG TPA: aldo/keto reductase [Candidatus Mediterraneibacter surreyensis]|nr:aldo/keto reductase [Candidatus Mediterraneibacter surreyensis]